MGCDGTEKSRQKSNRGRGIFQRNLQPQAAPHGLAQTIPLFSIRGGVFREKRLMIRTSAPFASLKNSLEARHLPGEILILAAL